MNLVQEAAYELIQADARFLYSLVHITHNARNIDSNYISMSIPYIGLFADGAEQWCKKLGVQAPCFSLEEKEYYTQLRLGHKLFELSSYDFQILLINKLRASDEYFYGIRSLLEKIKGYYNVGTDIFNGEFCGNTILCALYTPIDTLGNNNCGITIRNLSIIAGKMAAFFGCINHPVYVYNDKQVVRYKDYHFHEKSPLKMKNNLGVVLFSMLCSLN